MEFNTIYYLYNPFDIIGVSIQEKEEYRKMENMHFVRHDIDKWIDEWNHVLLFALLINAYLLLFH